MKPDVKRVIARSVTGRYRGQRINFSKPSPCCCPVCVLGTERAQWTERPKRASPGIRRGQTEPAGTTCPVDPRQPWSARSRRDQKGLLKVGMVTAPASISINATKHIRSEKAIVKSLSLCVCVDQRTEDRRQFCRHRGRYA